MNVKSLHGQAGREQGGEERRASWCQVDMLQQASFTKNGVLHPASLGVAMSFASQLVPMLWVLLGCTVQTMRVVSHQGESIPSLITA